MDAATLVYDIDSSQAVGAARALAQLERASAGVATEASKLIKTYRGADGRFISNADAARKNATEIKSLAAEFNPALRAVYDLQRREIQLARAVELGVLSKKDAENSLAQYHNELRQTIPAIVAMERAEQEAARAAQAHADMLESLKREFNPLYAASKQYEVQLERLNMALKEGAVNQRQYEGALTAMNQAYQGGATALNKFGDSAEVAQHHAMNLGYQLNDIGMMMALGQNPFALMMQQGPQVAQIFAQMNAEGKKIGPTLLSAFTTILNPTTLVTLALIGGAAAFVQWAMSGRDAAEANTDFRDSLSDLAGSANAYATALRTANQNSFALTSQFGAQADNLQRLYNLNVQLEQIKLGQAIRDSANQALVAYEGLSGQLDNIIRLSSAAMEDTLGMGTATDMLASAISGLSDEFGLSVGQALDLNAALEDMSKARTIEEQAEAAEAFGEALVSAARSGATIPPELIRIASEAGVAAVALREMAAASADAAAAWLSVGTNTGTFITGYEPPPMPEPNKPRRGRGGGGGGSGSRGGGGGKSEADQLQEEMQRRYEVLQEGFQAEYQLAMQTYVTDQETLQWALEQKLITLQQYEAQKAMLYTATWGTEYEQQMLQYQLDQEALTMALEQKLISYEDYYRRLKELQFQNLMSDVNRNDMAQDLSNTAQYFGMLQSLTDNGYDKLNRLQQTFAASASLVNAYLAASQALADPSLGFWGKMAAYGKVLAAGLGLHRAIKGSGGSSGGGGGGGMAAAAPAQEPQRTVLVNLQGDEWLVGMAENILEQIYEQSKDGRVIVSRI